MKRLEPMRRSCAEAAGPDGAASGALPRYRQRHQQGGQAALEDAAAGAGLPRADRLDRKPGQPSAPWMRGNPRGMMPSTAM